MHKRLSTWISTWVPPEYLCHYICQYLGTGPACRCTMSYEPAKGLHRRTLYLPACRSLQPTPTGVYFLSFLPAYRCTWCCARQGAARFTIWLYILCSPELSSQLLCLVPSPVAGLLRPRHAAGRRGSRLAARPQGAHRRGGHDDAAAHGTGAPQLRGCWAQQRMHAVPLLL